MKININFSFVFVLALIVVCESGLCVSSSSAEEEGFVTVKTSTLLGGTVKTSTLLGGLRDYKGNKNNGEIESIGRFAVQEHNKKENAILEFARVIKAKEQVVAGKMYHLTLEAIDAGKKKIYEAKVWVKPGMNFKQLQEFRHATDARSFTSADLGVKQGY